MPNDLRIAPKSRYDPAYPNITAIAERGRAAAQVNAAAHHGSLQDLFRKKFWLGNFIKNEIHEKKF